MAADAAHPSASYDAGFFESRVDHLCVESGPIMIRWPLCTVQPPEQAPGYKSTWHRHRSSLRDRNQRLPRPPAG